MDNKANIPIGSVVKLRDSTEFDFMIIGHGIPGDEGIYDYSAVLYPQGAISNESLFIFNEEEVETVVWSYS